MTPSLPLAAALALAAPMPEQAPVPAPTTAPVTSYADLADLTLGAPVIADVVVRSTARVKDAAGVAPGATRLYVEADVLALIRGAGGLPPRVGYLVDVLPDARGKLPAFKKVRMLVFARPAPGTPGQLQLVAPDAQRGWSAADDSRVRTIAAAALSPDSPPRLTGVREAFHVAGALPGEGETQVFLQTADSRPVSLSVLRRPGEQPRWAVALSEIVDEAAAPPARDTLLWYRLACSLPPALPPGATASLAPADAAIAAEDYRFVVAQLGPCGRTRG